MKTRYWGKCIVLFYMRVQEGYNVEECDKFVVEIRSKSFQAQEYLTKMAIEHWALLFFRTSINMIMSNNTESLNTFSRRIKELSIFAMIKNFRNKLQQQFHDRHVISRSCTSVLAPAQKDKFFKAIDIMMKLNVEPLDKSRFFAKCAPNKSDMVDLQSIQLDSFYVSMQSQWNRRRRSSQQSSDDSRSLECTFK